MEVSDARSLIILSFVQSASDILIRFRGTAMADKENKIQIVEWDWRSSFTDTNLNCGKSDADKDMIQNFHCDPDGRWANGVTQRGFQVSVGKAPGNYEEFLDYPDWNFLRSSLKPNESVRDYYSCTCTLARNGTRCRHLASLMFTWEAKHGPFVFTADPAIKKRHDEKIRQERRKRLEQIGILTNASDYFKMLMDPMPKNIYFQLDELLRKRVLEVNMREVTEAEKLIQTCSGSFSWSYGFKRDGDQILTASWHDNRRKVDIRTTQSDIFEMSCNCASMCLYSSNGWYYYRPSTAHICSHVLALWIWLREQVLEKNPGDKTDPQASRLIDMLSNVVHTELTTPESEEEEETAEKLPLVDLTPRIIIDYTPKLYFDLSVSGARPLLVKGFSELVDAVENEKEYPLGKNVSPDFSKLTFSEKTKKWYPLILDRVRTIEQMNKMQNRYYSGYTAGNSINLEGYMLDTLFDLAEGSSIMYQNGTRSESHYIRVVREMAKARITLSPVLADKHLIGINIVGKVPSVFEGAHYKYVINGDQFARISDDELNYIQPFQDITRGRESFRCTIGETKFTEFAYRILPALRESGQVQLTDNVSSLLDNVLPPAPEFTFYIDIANKNLTCRSTVQYGEEEPLVLGFSPFRENQTRDSKQENRVIQTIQNYFPQTDKEEKTFCQPLSDEALIRLKTEGFQILSRFGVVNGSDAFRRIQFRSVPHASLSISLDSDLLDLSIKTTDLTPDELLEILASYRQKKRWHRLRSGDFVDLSHPQELEDLDRTLNSMDLSIEDLLKGDVHLPKYRALYVDKLLETHDELAASRDKEFKALIRSFQTIRDSDFEVPKSLESTLRPYQTYGFRWLSTVSTYGFGGILADEMGLGKTLQMLSWLQSQKEAGEHRPALVVCPASLVYNWQEECRRFTPELSVRALDGNLDHRKELLNGIKNSTDCVDLYVTSYNLLQRDIALYDKTYFSAVILDEAQYIKNQKTAVSKSVRILKASHRFALTGTPIENRLSELWSIFDFLMPGFLYTSAQFAEEFEVPIMKFKDPDATTRLSRMTEPFILRRKKMDVLKDLPEKLEETRSFAMDEDQRKLYDAQVVHMRAMLESSSNFNEDKIRILAEITRLRQICCDPSLVFENYHGSSTKRAACMDLVESAIDGGHRMLIFSQFTSMLALLASDLKAHGISFFTITGATSKQERLRLVNTFNSGDVPVFLISLKAGGVGLNLTGADVVIHYDPWWNIAVQNQATDRAHRIGQTRQVTVMKLIAAETIEDRIIQLQEAKRDLAEAIISGESNSLMSLSKEELMALIG